MIHRRTATGIALFALLAVTSFWLARGGRDDDGDVFDPVNTRLDYALQDFRARLFDDQGRPLMRIRAPRLANDALTGIGTITSPVIELAQDGAVWNIIADAARISADREHILLSGEVTIVRDDAPTVAPVEIRTRELQLDVTPKVAHTDAPVTVLDGRNRVDGVGMRVEFDTRRFTLNDEVRGRYEVN